MIIQNNTTGKQHTVPKEKYNALTIAQKAGFTVISETDANTTDQIVLNKVENKADKKVVDQGKAKEEKSSVKKD